MLKRLELYFWQFNILACAILLVSENVGTFIVQKQNSKICQPEWNSIHSHKKFKLSISIICKISVKWQRQIEWYSQTKFQFCLYWETLFHSSAFFIVSHVSPHKDIKIQKKMWSFFAFSSFFLAFHFSKNKYYHSNEFFSCCSKVLRSPSSPIIGLWWCHKTIFEAAPFTLTVCIKFIFLFRWLCYKSTFFVRWKNTLHYIFEFNLREVRSLNQLQRCFTFTFWILMEGKILLLFNFFVLVFNGTWWK